MTRKWIGYIGVGSLMCAALGCGILYTRQARLRQDDFGQSAAVSCAGEQRQRGRPEPKTSSA